MQRTQVLIVGGSLVGLSASLFLSWRGVGNIVVEKHRGSSPHPRAIGYTQRTLELFRAVGIGDRIPQVPAGTRLRRAQVSSLVGDWQEETEWTPGDTSAHDAELSPCTGAAIAQDRLEPILRSAALDRGSELQLGVEFLSFRQAPEGVVAQVRNRESGERYEIHADYLIAADGAYSDIRTQLGIEQKGVGHLLTLRSVLFRCPEAEDYLHRGIHQFSVEQPDFRAFLTTYQDGRWVLMFPDDRERSEAELAAAILKALGKDMAFEIVTTGRWEMAGRIAERYSEGRIFLAGDAAHQLPPTRGGFGANTGIDDVFNLAWKLEWVLAGRSEARLLDTYNDERQPIGWLRHRQTFARPDYAKWSGNALAGETLYSDAAMELGQLHRSSSAIGAGPELPPAAHPDIWAGQPGTRAPHVWVVKQQEKISTIDLFGKNFTLLTSDSRWIAAAHEVSRALGIEIATVLVGEDIELNAAVFAKHFGISATGASLVRPDGLVGWRATELPAHPESALQEALSAIAALT